MVNSNAVSVIQGGCLVTGVYAVAEKAVHLIQQDAEDGRPWVVHRTPSVFSLLETGECIAV